MSRPGTPGQRQHPSRPESLGVDVHDAESEATPLFDQTEARIPLQQSGR